MSVVCPNCQHDNFEGSLFCAECGTKLITEDGLSTAAVSATNSQFKNVTAEPLKAPVISTNDAIISLHIVETGQILPLTGRNEFTVGRVSEGQSILPDIDLSPYDAYTNGVSRLHATLRVKGNQSISITDLGSSNGTHINKSKITPHKEHEISHGDIVMFGRLKIQALVRQEN
jgi:pSer/pThr/pTyr-binding forkhead associated (FHA) protein